MPNEATLLFEDAAFMYRSNFEGRPTKFKDAGEREITVQIPEDQVDKMIADGWNVKRAKDQDTGDYTGQAYLPVKVDWGYRSPRIVQVTSRGGTLMEEDMVGLLDSADIQNFDVLVRGYDYDVNGTKGRKAYLKTFVAFIAEDYLELKYADLFAGMSQLPIDEGFDVADDYQLAA